MNRFQALATLLMGELVDNQNREVRSVLTQTLSVMMSDQALIDMPGAFGVIDNYSNLVPPTYTEDLLAQIDIILSPDGVHGDVAMSNNGDIISYFSTLDHVPAPTASVNFNGQQATALRIENRTSDPGSPAVGQIWLRTDL